MINTGSQIRKLIEASGKAAPVMTKALKDLGNGSMQAGIKRLADFCVKEGIKVGTIRGAIYGVAGTVALGGLIFLVRKAIKDHQFHKEEGKVILKALQDNLEGHEEDDNSEPSYNAASVDEQR